MSNTKENSQSNFQSTLFGLGLSKSGNAPLHAQLAEALRTYVLSGGYGGLRLPSSRAFAAELGVSRMTVTSAYDQLVAEGYLSTRQGDGTYVANDLPHLAAPAPLHHPKMDPPQAYPPLYPGVPDQKMFPHREWARHLERAWRAPDDGLLGRAHPFGWYPLRRAICAHLAAWRGLNCAPEQIVITAGAWDAFDMIQQAAKLGRQTIGFEDPGWPALRAQVAQTGLIPKPIRIDDEGINPADLPRDLAALIVTPSRHYPTGVALPLPRRLELLQWAETSGALVIEDDYDSEFRYQGQPLPSLAGLEGLNRVLYMGSFSKLLSPSLRIGYLVLPDWLVAPVQDFISVAGARASLLPQPALANFMDSGEFAIHLRRMRRTYARRQAHLRSALAPMSDFLRINPDPSGMHIVAGLGRKLRAGITDTEVAAHCVEAGLGVRALSAHAVLPNPPQGLLLGYTAYDEPEIDAAVETLGRVLSTLA